MKSTRQATAIRECYAHAVKNYIKGANELCMHVHAYESKADAMHHASNLNANPYTFSPWAVLHSKTCPEYWVLVWGVAR